MKSEMLQLNTWWRNIGRDKRKCRRRRRSRSFVAQCWHFFRFTAFVKSNLSVCLQFTVSDGILWQRWTLMTAASCVTNGGQREWWRRRGVESCNGCTMIPVSLLVFVMAGWCAVYLADTLLRVNICLFVFVFLPAQQSVSWRTWMDLTLEEVWAVDTRVNRPQQPWNRWKPRY